jgi:hypothetical protein
MMAALAWRPAPIEGRPLVSEVPCADLSSIRPALVDRGFSSAPKIEI